MNETQLKKFLVDDFSIGDLILAQAQLRALDAGYQDLGLDTPDWIADKASLVSKEIVVRNEVELKKRLKTAKLRREALSTADEKRRKLDDEITALEKRLQP